MTATRQTSLLNVVLPTAKAGFSMARVIIDLSTVKSLVQGHTESLPIIIIVSTFFALRLSFAIGLAYRHGEFARLHM